MMKQHMQFMFPVAVCVLTLVFVYTKWSDINISQPKSDEHVPMLKHWKTNSDILILFWTKVYNGNYEIQSSKQYYRRHREWPFSHVNEDCPVKCTLTMDRDRINEADLVVFHSRTIDFEMLPPSQLDTPWMLQGYENPVIAPNLKNALIMKSFSLSMSYRLDSDFPSPRYFQPSLEAPLPFEDRIPAPLAVFTNCEKVRTEYLRQLMTHMGVDSYGKCLQNKETLVQKSAIFKNGRPVFKTDKEELTRKYRFSLVFFNTDCDYFVDDRLTHALDAGSVPIVMGTTKIFEFLPGNLRNAIINVRDFASPAKLAEYITYLNGNKTAYMEYLKWKDIGLGDIWNTTIGRWWSHDNSIFCQACIRLSRNGVDKRSHLLPDMCRPRSYSDWGLQDPSKVMTSKKKPVKKS